MTHLADRASRISPDQDAQNIQGREGKACKALPRRKFTGIKASVQQRVGIVSNQQRVIPIGLLSCTGGMDFGIVVWGLLQSCPCSHCFGPSRHPSGTCCFHASARYVVALSAASRDACRVKAAMRTSKAVPQHQAVINPQSHRHPKFDSGSLTMLDSVLLSYENLTSISSSALETLALPLASSSWHQAAKAEALGMQRTRAL